MALFSETLPNSLKDLQTILESSEERDIPDLLNYLSQIQNETFQDAIITKLNTSFNISDWAISEVNNQPLIFKAMQEGNLSLLKRYLSDDLNNEALAKKLDKLDRLVPAGHKNLIWFLTPYPTMLDWLLDYYPKTSLTKALQNNNAEGNTSIHHAAQSNARSLEFILSTFPDHEEIYRALLHENFEGMTPIHIAAKENPEALKFILQRFRPDIRPQKLSMTDAWDRTPLDLAVQYNLNSLQIIQEMLNTDTKSWLDILVEFKLLKSTINTAIKYNPSFLEILLSQLGAEKYQVNLKKHNLLHLAIVVGNLESCRVIFRGLPTEITQKMLNASREDGNNILHLTKGKELFDFILPHLTENTLLTLSRAQNKKGDTALHEAARAANPYILKTILNQLKNDTERRATLSILNREGESPLHVMARQNPHFLSEVLSSFSDPINGIQAFLEIKNRRETNAFNHAFNLALKSNSKTPLKSLVSAIHESQQSSILLTDLILDQKLFRHSYQLDLSAITTLHFTEAVMSGKSSAKLDACIKHIPSHVTHINLAACYFHNKPYKEFRTLLNHLPASVDQISFDGITYFTKENLPLSPMLLLIKNNFNRHLEQFSQEITRLDKTNINTSLVEQLHHAYGALVSAKKQYIVDGKQDDFTEKCHGAINQILAQSALKDFLGLQNTLNNLNKSSTFEVIPNKSSFFAGKSNSCQTAVDCLRRTVCR